MKKSVYIIILSCLVFSLKLKAAYFAGNITYSWVSGYTYKVTYTTYTSVYVISDPYCQVDSVCFGDGTSGTLLRNNGFCGGMCAPACDGVVLPGAVIRMNVYEANHTYPGPGNYTICFNQPNRHQGVINMPNSVNQTMAFESLLVIPTFSTGKNTSPIFYNHPIESGCMNNGCFTHYPLATDFEGDSLSYEIAMCKGFAQMPVPGYSYPASGAGGTFSINPVSGLLSWCSPQLVGEYSVLIRIIEWRNSGNGNYFMVGYVERDTYLSVTNCTRINDIFEKENPISAFPNPVSKNLTISFNQNTAELFTVELCDIAGRILKTMITKEPTIQLQTDDLYPGIYFLKINGDKHTSLIKKIIKQ